MAINMSMADGPPWLVLVIRGLNLINGFKFKKASEEFSNNINIPNIVYWFKNKSHRKGQNNSTKADKKILRMTLLSSKAQFLQEALPRNSIPNEFLLLWISTSLWYGSQYLTLDQTIKSCLVYFSFQNIFVLSP